jgi:nitrite reductase (NO-forming)
VADPVDDDTIAGRAVEEPAGRSGRMIAVIASVFVIGALLSVVWAVRLPGHVHPARPRTTGPGTVQARSGGADARHETPAVSAPRYAREHGVRYEAYQRPDPTLPAAAPGPVKRFRVDVLMHRTKVADDRPPMRVWSFGVDGRFMRGTGVSPPMVVNQGDRVDITFVNGGSAATHVDMPHSLDIHAARVPPNIAFKTIAPGATWHYRFVARDPGVFMYHCATEPMVWHLGSGMVGMFVVKPRNLPKVDRELWLVQQEYYAGHRAGADGDYTKMLDEHPDVIAFNGYANQYMEHPIRVRAGERIRMYVLNPGPSHMSSFHVIGAIFDRTWSEGDSGGPAQVLSLPPSTGGYVDFTLPQDGAYPFVDHNFASMAKGAMGMLLTEHAPKGAGSGL